MRVPSFPSLMRSSFSVPFTIAIEEADEEDILRDTGRERNNEYVEDSFIPSFPPLFEFKSSRPLRGARHTEYTPHAHTHNSKTQAAHLKISHPAGAPSSSLLSVPSSSPSLSSSRRLLHRGSVLYNNEEIINLLNRNKGYTVASVSTVDEKKENGSSVNDRDDRSAINGLVKQRLNEWAQRNSLTRQSLMNAAGGPTSLSSSRGSNSSPPPLISRPSIAMAAPRNIVKNTRKEFIKRFNLTEINHGDSELIQGEHNNHEGTTDDNIGDPPHVVSEGRVRSGRGSKVFSIIDELNKYSSNGVPTESEALPPRKVHPPTVLNRYLSNNPSPVSSNSSRPFHSIMVPPPVAYSSSSVPSYQSRVYSSLSTNDVGTITPHSLALYQAVQYTPNTPNRSSLNSLSSSSSRSSLFSSQSKNPAKRKQPLRPAIRLFPRSSSPPLTVVFNGCVLIREYSRECGGGCSVPRSGGFPLGLGWRVEREYRELMDEYKEDRGDRVCARVSRHYPSSNPVFELPRLSEDQRIDLLNRFDPHALQSAFFQQWNSEESEVLDEIRLSRLSNFCSCRPPPLQFDEDGEMVIGPSSVYACCTEESDCACVRDGIGCHIEGNHYCLCGGRYNGPLIKERQDQEYWCVSPYSRYEFDECGVKQHFISVLYGGGGDGDDQMDDQDFSLASLPHSPFVVRERQDKLLEEGVRCVSSVGDRLLMDLIQLHDKSLPSSRASSNNNSPKHSRLPSSSSSSSSISFIPPFSLLFSSNSTGTSNKSSPSSSFINN